MKILLSIVFISFFGNSFSQEVQSKEKLTSIANELIEDNNVDFLNKSNLGFKVLKLNPTTNIKNQQQTGTCWSFSTTSLLESQSIKNNIGNFDLSEMYTVRNIYFEKAKNYLLRQGHAQFSEGGLGHDVIASTSTYGAIPENSYTGLPDKIKSYNHTSLYKELKSYIDSLLQIAGKNSLSNWTIGYNNILDKYLGVAPENFTYNNKTYTPISFSKDVLHFNAEDYINITSFNHHPYYQPFILEVPDNFSNGSYFNVHLSEMIQAVKVALLNGYTVLWDTDISNDGFNKEKGIALNITKEKLSSISTINPDIAEDPFNENIRQNLFENLKTQDDHLMHIIGMEKSKDGKIFFIVKNSWGKNSGPYKGYIHVSEAYFAINTISLVLPKAALNKDLLKQLKIQ